MSRTTGLQRRTTYLISLTLVKLESVGAAGEAEEAGGGGDGAPGPGGAAAAPRTPEPGRARRPERLFQRQDALRISTAGPGPPGPDAPRPRSPASPPAVPPKPDPALLPPPLPAVPPKPDPRGAKGTLEGPGERGLAALDIPQPAATPRRPLLSQATWGGPEAPPEGGRAPPPPLDPPTASPHPSAGPRRLRLAGPKPPKAASSAGSRGTPDPRAAKTPGKPAGSRLSWPEGEGKGRPKAGGKSEGPPPRARLSPSKGKSKTLDYSDLQHGPGALVPAPAPETGLKRGREGGRASTRDRKMLKFISGIFTKSPAATPTHPTPPWSPPGAEPARATPHSEYRPGGTPGWPRPRLGVPSVTCPLGDRCVAVPVGLCLSFPGEGRRWRVLCGTPVPPVAVGVWVLGDRGALTPPRAGLCRGLVPVGRCGVSDLGDPVPRFPHGGSGVPPASVVPSRRPSVCPRLHPCVTPVHPVPHLPASPVSCCPPPRVPLSACTHLGTPGCVGSTCRARGWQLGDNAGGDRRQR